MQYSSLLVTATMFVIFFIFYQLLRETLIPDVLYTTCRAIAFLISFRYAYEGKYSYSNKEWIIYVPYIIWIKPLVLEFLISGGFCFFKPKFWLVHVPPYLIVMTFFSRDMMSLGTARKIWDNPWLRAPIQFFAICVELMTTHRIFKSYSNHEFGFFWVLVCFFWHSYIMDFARTAYAYYKKPSQEAIKEIKCMNITRIGLMNVIYITLFLLYYNLAFWIKIPEYESWTLYHWLFTYNVLEEIIFMIHILFAGWMSVGHTIRVDPPPKEEPKKIQDPTKKLEPLPKDPIIKEEPMSDQSKKA